MSRMLGKPPHKNEPGVMEAALVGLWRSLPEVGAEWGRVSARQRRRTAKLAANNNHTPLHPMNFGEHTHKHVQAFAAKLTFALHYVETCSIVPTTGGVAVRVWSNANRMEGEILDREVEAMLGPGKTLHQGKMNVRNQFEYFFAISPDRTMGMYFISIGYVLAFVSFVATDRSLLAGDQWEGRFVHEPGKFLTYKDPSLIGSMSLAWQKKL